MLTAALLASLLAAGADAGVLNKKANLVLGQPDFDHSSPDLPDSAGLTQAHGLAVDVAGGRLIVLDASRALVWNSPASLSDGQGADAVLGQPDFNSIVGVGPGPSALNFPFGALVDASGALWVADANYSRVLRFEPPFTTGKLPDLVLGQPDFTQAGGGTAADRLNQPRGVAQDPAGNIWVSDYANHRVLRFSPPFSNGMSADRVLGQADFASGQPNRGGSPAAATLKYPGPLAFDAAGNLWVCDSYNSRALRFAAAPASGAAATLVLGQADFAGGTVNRGGLPAADTLDLPAGLALDAAGGVWVGDTLNHRVLRYAPPLSNGMAASTVLGQAAFTVRAPNRGGTAAADSLDSPEGLAVDASGALWVADVSNYRVLRFSPAFSSGMAASRVLGQPDFVHNSQNRVDARGFHGAFFAALDAAHNRLFVADAGNNRVLWWNDAAGLSNGRAADGVLGQPDFNSGASLPTSAHALNYPLGLAVDAGGALWVADDINNRVLRFSPPFTTGMDADLVLGQAGFAAADTLSPPTAASLNVPYSLTFDAAGALWVADYSNGRALRFSPPFSSGMSADLVVGQPGFGAAAPFAAAADTLLTPSALLFDPAGALWVSDSEANRVLRFSPPLSAGKAADLVLGQPDFVSAGWAASPAAANLAYPTGLARTSAGELWVADTFNHRLLQFAPPFANGMAASRVLGQPGFASNDSAAGEEGLAEPTGTFVDAANAVWTADHANSRVLKFEAPETKTPVGASSSQTVRLDGTTGGFKLDVPVNAFAADCSVSMALPEPQSLPAAQDGLKRSTVAVEITNSLGLQPLRSLTLTIPYRDGDLAGLDPSRLAIAYFNPATGKWVSVPSTHDPVARTVTGRLSHLSLFAIVQLAPAADLSGVYVYPNPYKPGSGTTFDDGPQGSGVAFSGLTPRARIRVATLAGDLVADFTSEDGTGRALWNARNGRGERVASGVYLYVVTDLDGRSQSRSGRFAVVR